MATIDDQATEREEKDRELALKHRMPELKHIGACHNCSEPCAAAFCSRECMDDYEQRERFKSVYFASSIS